MAVEADQFVPGRDDEEIIALRSRVWGADHAFNSPAYFEWLFRANPALRGGGSILRKDGLAIGFCGLLARSFHVAGERAPVAQCVDYMVDPGVRGGMGGLYGFRLMQHWLKLAAERGFRYGIGFPNVNSARLATSPKLGWLTTFRTTLLVRPFARLTLPAQPVGRLPPPIVAAGFAALSGWSRVSAAVRARPARGGAVSLTGFDAGFDAPPGWSGDAPIAGNASDAAYLNWRFVRHPLNRYDLVGWEIDGQIRGHAAAILREAFGVKATLLVELAARDDDAAIEQALIAETLRRARASGAAMVATLALADTARYRNLLRSGFIPVPARFDPKPFLMATHGFGDADAASRAIALAWRFNWADMDTV